MLRRAVLVFALAGAVCATLFAPAAQAAVITRTFAFSGSAFTNLAGVVPAPTDPVTGQVTVTFDTAASVTDQTAGITLDSLNIALGSAIAYSYTPGTDTLFIGGMSGGVVTLATTSNDFEATFDAASTGAPGLSELVYTASVRSNGWITLTGSVSLVETQTGVPEPASLALLGAGLAGLGFARRRRVS